MRHDCNAVIANMSVENDLVARAGAIRGDVYVAFYDSDARRGDKYLIALSAIHYLCIPCHQLHAA